MPEQFAKFIHSAPTGRLKPSPLEADVEGWAKQGHAAIHRKEDKRLGDYDIGNRATEHNKYWCDLVPQQRGRGLIDPKLYNIESHGGMSRQQ